MITSWQAGLVVPAFQAFLTITMNNISSQIKQSQTPKDTIIMKTLIQVEDKNIHTLRTHALSVWLLYAIYSTTTQWQYSTIFFHSLYLCINKMPSEYVCITSTLAVLRKREKRLVSDIMYWCLLWDLVQWDIVGDDWNICTIVSSHTSHSQHNYSHTYTCRVTSTHSRH